MEEQIILEQTEQAPPVEKKKASFLKWLIPLVLLPVILAVAAYVVLFQVNTFSLVMELSGEPELDVDYGTVYEEPGYRAVLYGTMFCKEGISPEDMQLTVQGQVGEELGSYVLIYEASYGWWQASAQRSVRVVDREKPVITLVDVSEETILPGMVYEEEGFTAFDNHDGDITDRVTRVENMGVITYAVLDSSGNLGYAEREIPYYDPVPPEIILTEGREITLPTGMAFVDPGYTAQDNADGDITEKVLVEGEVNIYVPGTYTLTYTVSDTFENVTTVTRNVQVTAAPRPEVQYPAGKTIYLTFDDGPGPYTEYLLDVLDYYGVKATFFVIDSGYDWVLKEIVDRGHSVGIHSVTHDYYQIYASPEAYFEDLYSMQDKIYDITGVRTTLMRFPGGGSNMVSRFNKGIMTLLTESVQDAGFQYFDWNVDSNDAGGATTTKKVIENVIDGVMNQRISVVLQHDIHPYSVDAVEDIIIWGLDNGYTFRALEETSPGFRHNVNN